MGAAELRRAHADPGEVRREVVPAFAARHLAGLGLLVEQVQAFVAGEEVDPVHLAHLAAGEGLHEAQRLADAGDDAAVVVGERRVLDEVEVPVLGVMQVGEAAVDQGADEVERQRGAFVAAQQELRIGRGRRR